MELTTSLKRISFTTTPHAKRPRQPLANQQVAQLPALQQLRLRKAATQEVCHQVTANNDCSEAVALKE